MYGAGSAKDRGTAENDSRYGQQLVAGPGIGLGLADACDINQRRQRRHQPGQHIYQGQPLIEWDSCITGAIEGETDRAE